MLEKAHCREEGVEVLPAVTIEVARATGLIKKASLNRIIVDNTVMIKAVAHPTGSLLLGRCRQHLAKLVNTNPVS